MNIIKRDLGDKFKTVKIYPIADIHIGSDHFDKENFEQLLEKIASEENSFIILNGDLINNAIKTSVSDIYEETMNPQKQLEMLIEYFRPLREKIIGVTQGNHEARTTRLTGIDILKNFCYMLNIEDVYSAVGNMIFLSFGSTRPDQPKTKVTYSIYQNHGSGGGKKVGSKANKLQALAYMVHADIYIHSHTHTPITFKENYIMTYNNSCGVKEVSRLFVNTNAYEGFGGYGEAYAFTPSNREQVEIELSYHSNRGKTEKHMRATL